MYSRTSLLDRLIVSASQPDAEPRTPNHASATDSTRPQPAPPTTTPSPEPTAAPSATPSIAEPSPPPRSPTRAEIADAMDAQRGKKPLATTYLVPTQPDAPPPAKPASSGTLDALLRRPGEDLGAHRHRVHQYVSDERAAGREPDMGEVAFALTDAGKAR